VFKLGGSTVASLLGMSLESNMARDVLPPVRSKTIGIQVGAVSFVDEGVERVLDMLQARGCVDTVYLTTFTYGRGLAGRQVPGQKFPDHGVQESDEAIFHGGNYALPHPKYYRETVLKNTRAPDHGDLDIVEAVLPEAKKWGLRIFCSVEDVWRPSVPMTPSQPSRPRSKQGPTGLCCRASIPRCVWTTSQPQAARSATSSAVADPCCLIVTRQQR